MTSRSFLARLQLGEFCASSRAWCSSAWRKLISIGISHRAANPWPFRPRSAAKRGVILRRTPRQPWDHKGKKLAQTGATVKKCALGWLMMCNQHTLYEYGGGKSADATA